MVFAPQLGLVPALDDLKLGVLFDRVLDAVVVATLAGGRIVAWNLAAEKLFGYSADEAVGRSIELLMPRPLAKLHRAGLERYLRTGHGMIVDADEPVEVPARKSTGEEIRVAISLSELRSPTSQRLVVAIMRDASHHRQAELDGLELAQALVAQANAEGAVADLHEVVEAARNVLRSNPSRESLHRLVSELDEYECLERDSPRTRVMSAELVDLVYFACDAARRRAGNRHLLVYVPPSARARFDAGIMRQVLDRVLEAAIQNTDDDAKIRVCVEVDPSQHVQVLVQTDAARDGTTVTLGICLARTLMKAQGGTLSAAFGPNGDLSVSLRLRAGSKPWLARPVQVGRRASRAVGVGGRDRD
jgi:PAS domain S-box-containing protein